MTVKAPVAEVFTSFQGEGPLVGVRQVFIRLRGCDLKCKYCDTPQAQQTGGDCRIETAPFSQQFRTVSNPLSAGDAFSQITGPDGEKSNATDIHSIAVTGGEPLLYPEFVGAIGDLAASQQLPIYLETAGHHPDELQSLRDTLTFICTDYKLPCTVEEPPEPQTFVRSYAVADELLVAVKMVVTDSVTVDEVSGACQRLAAVSERGPVVLQPVTPVRAELEAPTAAQLNKLWQAATAHIRDVRVIPQCHRLAGLW